MYSPKYKLKFLLLTVLALTTLVTAGLVIGHSNSPTFAGTQCGKGKQVVNTAIDLGCRGDQNANPTVNPILDMTFAITRFLTAGIGIVVVGSVIVGGIQYSTAQGEPQKQAAARGRVISSIAALVLYLFTFAILQWLVPGGMF